MGWKGSASRALGNLCRLPRRGRQRRCTGDIIEKLDRALGEASEVFEWTEVPLSLDAAMDLPDRMESTEPALTYLCKAVDRGMVIGNVKLLEKHGASRGTGWRATNNHCALPRQGGLT